jgi:hypothetical protein
MKAEPALALLQCLSAGNSVTRSLPLRQNDCDKLGRCFTGRFRVVSKNLIC